MSEVLGFMMGFFMSFLLLIIALYGFQLVSQDAADTETRAVFTDVAGRITNGVLVAIDVGVKRVGSVSVADSEDILYQQVLLVPYKVHGQQYRVTLSSTEIRVTSEDGRITEAKSTFNLQIPTCGNAAAAQAAAVCGVYGSFLSNPDGVRIMYEYKAGESTTKCTAASVPTNCVSIS